jgi:glycosyltransferase involved in cell wall biosynthesis
MHDRGAFFEEVKRSGIPVFIVDYTADMSNRVNGLMKVYNIAKEFKKINPDIIHSFHYLADYSEALAARLAGIKWVYTKKNMNWGGFSKNGWLLRTKFANAIVAQNTDMLSTFFKTSEKVSLISRGVNTNEFVPKPINLTLKESLGIAKDQTVIGIVANLVPVKGVENLIEAFKQILERQKDIVLLIVGDDNSGYATELKNQAGELLGAKIIFTGKRPDVSDVVQLIDIFVLPTLNKGRKEGSPVALLEAMSTARYVVASNIPGVKDQLVNYPDLIFEAGSVDEIKHKVEHALSIGEEERKRIGAILREHVIQNFSIEKETRKHEDFYLYV